MQHYVKHYNCIELNATHYKIYSPSAIAKWAEKAAGKNFMFCPKMYNGITHFGGLKNKKFLVDEFLRGIVAFEKHLGPIFIQLSDSFSPKRKEELFTFLLSLPKHLQFFVEVRHTNWFTNEKTANEYFTFLKENNLGAVITDAAGRRDCCHMHLTLPKTFIRYVGNSLHKTDYSRINDWIKRIKFWMSKGIEDVYFFMHMHNETFSPELTVYMVNEINKTCKLNLQKPIFIPQENKLF